MKGKGIFVTGTDTGVGKTIVSAILARLFSRKGIRTGVMKPVTSGCTEAGGRLVSGDGELLRWACYGEDDADVTPYLLKEPLAPSVAAKLDGVRIDFATIREAYDRLAAKHELVIVEGAGGLMVPLAGGLLVADLVSHLRIPLLIVARPGLGTVNHTLLTAYCARQMGLEVSGVIINDYPESPGKAEEHAPHLIGSLSGVPVLGVFPHADRDDKSIVEQTVAALEADPVTGIMLRELLPERD